MIYQNYQEIINIKINSKKESIYVTTLSSLDFKQLHSGASIWTDIYLKTNHIKKKNQEIVYEQALVIQISKSFQW